MKTIVFFNRKGGVGKTSLSFLFSRYLAAAKHTVSFLDLDPQRTATNNYSRLFGIERDVFMNNNLFNVLLNKQSVKSSMIQVDEYTQLYAGSYDIAEIQSSTSPHAVTDITEMLETEYCIIDNAPNFSALISSSISAGSIIIVPTLPAYEDLEQAVWSVQRSRKINREADIKVLLNQCKVEGVGGLSKQLLDVFMPHIKDELVTDVSIPQSKYIRSYTATGEKISNAVAKQSLLNSFGNMYSLITGNKEQVESF